MRYRSSTYWRDARSAFTTLWTGLIITFRHFWKARESRAPIHVSQDNYFDQKDGIVTVQYPHESLPVPDNGRYRLHNEIDDCIVCDKCAKICPVDCIDIVGIKAVEELGKTSDGTPKRIHAATFDIDMAKCCFCGLCTTVCPTECLTMTKAYDFSEYDIIDHIYSFAEMTEEEITAKKADLARFEAAKQQQAQESADAQSKKPIGPAKPVFKPKIKPVAGTSEAQAQAKALMQQKMAAKKSDSGETPEKPSKPKIKPRIPSVPTDDVSNKKIQPKPVIKPKKNPGK